MHGQLRQVLVGRAMRQSKQRRIRIRVTEARPALEVLVEKVVVDQVRVLRVVNVRVDRSFLALAVARLRGALREVRNRLLFQVLVRFFRRLFRLFRSGLRGLVFVLLLREDAVVRENWVARWQRVGEAIVAIFELRDGRCVACEQHVRTGLLIALHTSVSVVGPWNRGWRVMRSKGPFEGCFGLVSRRVGVLFLRSLLGADVVGHLRVVQVAHVAHVQVRMEVDRGRDRHCVRVLRTGVVLVPFPVVDRVRVRVLLVLRRLLPLRCLLLLVVLFLLRCSLTLVLLFWVNSQYLGVLPYVDNTFYPPSNC